MLHYLMGALKIGVLVIVGGLFLLHLPEIRRNVIGEHKIMSGKEAMGKIMKGIGVFVSLLGLAFYAGAFLANVQGILMQVMPLAVTGTVCLVCGIVCFVAGSIKKREK